MGQKGRAALVDQTHGALATIGRECGEYGHTGIFFPTKGTAHGGAEYLYLFQRQTEHRGDVGTVDKGFL